MHHKPLVFIDVETTGGSYVNDRIIEIGIIRVENQKKVATYSSLINPQTHLSPDITRLTGILPQDLESAPTFNQIKQDVLEIMSGAIVVAHNSSFDYGFVRSEFKRHNIAYTSKHLCTVKLSRQLFPQEVHHNLDAVINRCGLICHHRHRALGDAEAIWHFWQHVHRHHDQDNLQKAIALLLKSPTLPSTISKKTINDIPEAPGVYLFYNQDQAPLYIGKSVNLKERIMSHFSAATTSPKERTIVDSLHSIDTIPTAGDLHAQLLESNLIKSLQPIYNRRLRHHHALIALTQSTNTNGYFQANIQPATTVISPLTLLDCLNPSIRQKTRLANYVNVISYARKYQA
jgi:DNA polymerase III subunit epsilon